MPYYPPASAGGGVPTTRLVSTTAPITGGGDLSADRTHSIPAATDAVDGYLTAADHSLLYKLNGQASGSAPGYVAIGVPITGWKSGVDLKVAATTAIFTVPGSRTFTCTGAYVVITAVTGGAAVAFSYVIKESVGSTSMSPSGAHGSVVPTIGKSYAVAMTISSSPYSSAAAASIVNFVITTAFTTSTLVTGTVFVTGFYSI